MSSFLEIFLEVVERSHTSVSVAVTLVGALLALRLKTNLVRRFERRGHLKASMAGRIQVLGRWVVLLTVLLTVLHLLGAFENAWAVATTALAAVAVGVVAIWSILSNVLAAVLILVYRPYRIGDEIELLDLPHAVGIRGRVVDMNLMFTILRQYDASTRRPALINVPNNLVFQKLVRLYGSDELSDRPSFFDPDVSDPSPAEP